MKCHACKGKGYKEVFNGDTGKIERKICSPCGGRGRIKSPGKKRKTGW